MSKSGGDWNPGWRRERQLNLHKNTQGIVVFSHRFIANRASARQSYNRH